MSCNKKSKKSFFSNLGTIIIIAMFLGIIVGALMGKQAHMFAPLGEVFMQLVKMVVIPLVAVSITSGAASLGNGKSAGKIGIATFSYYLLTTIIGVFLGLIAGNIFKPGLGIPIESIQSMFSNEYANKGNMPQFWETIKGIIPLNPIKSLVEGNILQIIFFSLFLGFGISSLKKDKKEFLLKNFNYINEALIFIIEKVLYVAPIGVFALMADTTGTFGYKILFLVLKLFMVCLLMFCIHIFGTYSLLIKLFSKTPVSKFFKKMYKVQLLALSTASSLATLPMNLETSQEELNVSKEVSSFVLPLGATINMDGDSIYYALVACFFAQMFGIHLGPAQYIAIIITATIGSIGQAGVPGPTLLVIAVLISANIPVCGLPILFGVDRIFDMLRTTVNITGDASCAIVVDNFKNLITKNSNTDPLMEEVSA